VSAAEAAKIAGVLSGADGGCYVCAGKLAAEMARLFPEHDWLALVANAGGWTREQLESS
jgi:hypothetical protein